MLRNITNALFASLLISAGCGSSPKDENVQMNADESGPMAEQAMVPSMSPSDSSATTPSNGGPVIINSVTGPGKSNVPQGTGTAAGLNPAHGMPGHRCDIAVGAPLNSPPGNVPAGTGGVPPAAGQVQAQPIPPPGLALPPGAATSPPPVAPGKTPPGMNPPHGEPGHDCSIAVGAPLKK